VAVSAVEWVSTCQGIGAPEAIVAAHRTWTTPGSVSNDKTRTHAAAVHGQGVGQQGAEFTMWTLNELLPASRPVPVRAILEARRVPPGGATVVHDHPRGALLP